jgi:hypothetical protein
VLAARPHLGAAADAIGSADLRWVAAAGALQLVAAAAPAMLWRAGFGLSGAALGRVRALALYASGSFLNSFLPGRVGGALRLGLFAAALPHEGRLRGCARSMASIAVARQVVLLVVVGTGVAVGGVATWLVAVPAVWLAGAAFACRRLGGSVDARLAGWAGTTALARAAAVAASLLALGVPRPLQLAAGIVLALELAAIFPLLPGNLGASAAVATALSAQGVPGDTAIAAGLLLHGLETAVGLGLGGLAAAALAVPRGIGIPPVPAPAA